MAENTLYFGDNLKILRDNLSDETIDLIYLDPPLGCSPTVREGAEDQANYNVFFRSPKGREAHAQITALHQTHSHWSESRHVGKAEFIELIDQPNTDVSEMMAEYE